jgi:hypothetical protein
VRPALPLSLVLLTACSLGPAPTVPAPSEPRCMETSEAMIGTWSREHESMELRPDGVLVRNGVEGTLRWGLPGHAMLRFGTSPEEEHTYALMTAATMIDVDRDGRAAVWGRVSALPAMPASCFDVRGSLVGDWTDGAERETFEADGRFSRASQRGIWTYVEPGALDVTIGRRTWRYHVALAAPDLMLSTLATPLALDGDPRGPSLVETRVR